MIYNSGQNKQKRAVLYILLYIHSIQYYPSSLIEARQNGFTLTFHKRLEWWAKHSDCQPFTSQIPSQFLTSEHAEVKLKQSWSGLFTYSKLAFIIYCILYNTYMQ